MFYAVKCHIRSFTEVKLAHVLQVSAAVNPFSASLSEQLVKYAMPYLQQLQVLVFRKRSVCTTDFMIDNV
jgi:hypothetical protein